MQVARTYKVGDVDAYHITMKMEGAMAMEIAMDSSQKVVSVYDNGDADVETTTSGGRMKGMGMERDLPTGPVQKMRITKFGTPVGGGPGAKGPGNGDGLHPDAQDAPDGDGRRADGRHRRDRSHDQGPHQGHGEAGEPQGWRRDLRDERGRHHRGVAEADAPGVSRRSWRRLPAVPPASTARSPTCRPALEAAWASPA